MAVSFTLLDFMKTLPDLFSSLRLGLILAGAVASLHAAQPPNISEDATANTYNASTGVLLLRGQHFSATGGPANDVVANNITFTGQGGSTHTLTDTANVEITNPTTFSVHSSSADRPR